MSSWNEDYLIINDSIFEGTTGSARFYVTRMVEPGMDVRKNYTSTPYWIINLSNLVLSDQQYEELQATHFGAEGLTYPVLCKNIRNYTFENADGDAQVVGTGTGVEEEFQLIKTWAVQGRTTRTEIIRYPWFDYPGFDDVNGNDYFSMAPLTVYVGGVLLTSDHWTVDRSTGILTLTQTGAITVKGGFLTKFLMP